MGAKTSAFIAPKGLEASPKPLLKNKQKSQPSPVAVSLFSLAAWPFWLTVLLVTIDRARLLAEFGFRYVGNDDSLFWLGASDFAHGVFREPCLYGQSYNIMIESMFSVPLLLGGMAHQYALPLVTSLMTLLPYFVFARRELRAGNRAGAVLLAALPMLLPIEYSMMTSMTRGFVTGVFFLVFFPLAEKIKHPNLRFLITGLCCGLALLANPNVLLLLPVLLAGMIAENFRSIKFYLFTALGALPAWLLHNSIVNYYASHHDGVLHEISGEMLRFSSETMQTGISNLSHHLQWLFPFWNEGGVLIPLVMAAAAVFLFSKKQKALAIGIAVSVVLLFVALGFPKIHDGGNHVLMPLSRMFIALPLALGIALAAVLRHVHVPQRFIQASFVVLVPLMLFRFADIPSSTRAALVSDEIHPVEMRAVEDLKRETKYLREIARREGADIIVALGSPYKYYDLQLWCHTGECWYNDFPQTLIPQYERRWWRYLEETKAVHRNILFIGGGENHWKKIMQNKSGITAAGEGRLMLHVLRNNTRPTIQLLGELGG